MIPNVTIMGSDTPRVSREYEALSRPCKCTSTLYTRFSATALNTVTSQVRLMLVSLHTHSHSENITGCVSYFCVNTIVG